MRAGLFSPLNSLFFSFELENYPLDLQHAFTGLLLLFFIIYLFGCVRS